MAVSVPGNGGLFPSISSQFTLFSQKSPKITYN